MKCIYTVSLLALILCTSVITNGQARLSQTTTSVSDTTPNLNDQLSVLTSLKNESLTDTFTGTIDFVVANKDSIINMPLVVGKPAFAGTVITLAPQQTRSALFTVTLQPNRFSIGVDIIIVWPVAAVQIIDSARAPINIQPALGITPVSQEGITAFVFGEQLFTQNNGSKSSLRRVQIYDLMGHIVGDYHLSDNTSVIPLHQLPAGVYVADIVGEMGAGKRLKFVK
ncbi:MAG: hypothetical protein JWO03_2155 [Bacteroidetes bacterium]|nr:hypothetical protein [Bacteroidota bacterium]